MANNNNYRAAAAEPSYSASYDSNSSAPSGSGFCWKQFCCALVCFILLLAVAAMIYVVVDGNRTVAKTSSSSADGGATPGSGSGRRGSSSTNPSSGGKDGPVRSFNWCGQHKKKLVLTFDDGPSVTATPNVLADLAQIGAKATFFVTPAVDGEPDSAKCALVEKILADGHQVKLHSYRHDDYMQMVDVDVTADLKKTRDWVERCAGAQRDRLRADMFRPPYGSLDYVRAQFISNELGYTIATWNLDTEDFRGGNATTLMERIADKYAQLMPDGQGSVVLLMHDKTYVQGGSLGLLPMVNKFFAERRGYDLITADQCYDGCDATLSFCKMDGVWPGAFEQP